MESQEFTVYFQTARSGWQLVNVRYGETEIPIYMSIVFDPYPALHDWLYRLASRNTPCSWYVNEEDTQIELIALMGDAGEERLKIEGHTRIGGTEDPNIYVLLDIALSHIEIAQKFFAEVKRMMLEIYETGEWGSDYRRLNWDEIESILAKS